MNKSDLIETLSSRANLTHFEATKTINTIFDSMADALVAGDRIEIRGFGSLEVREYEGYTGRNPKTSEEVAVKPKRSPFFKVGKELKERVMGSEK